MVECEDPSLEVLLDRSAVASTHPAVMYVMPPDCLICHPDYVASLLFISLSLHNQALIY